MPKEIKLSKGYIAICDDDDYEMLSKYKWHVALNCENYFAVTTIKENGKWTARQMTHLIKPDIKRILHINGNRLDNRKENLIKYNIFKGGRIGGKRNDVGSKYSKANASKYIGVFRGVSNRKIGNKTYSAIIIKAVIQVNKNKVYIGQFKTEIEAAMAYNKWAVQNIGSDAPLNIIPENYFELIEEEKQNRVTPSNRKDKVVQLNISDNSLIAVHDYLSVAARATKVNVMSLHNHLNPKGIKVRTQVGGFKFMYHTEYLRCLTEGFPNPIPAPIIDKHELYVMPPKIFKVNLRTNKVVSSYTSIAQAVNDLGTPSSTITISNACKQKGGVAYNHLWFYCSDYEKYIKEKQEQ